MYSELNDIECLVNDFITYKRTLGYKYNSESRVLSTFKRYILESRDKGFKTLNEEVVEGWCALRISESRKSQFNRICLLRQFAIYLESKGYSMHIPKSIYNSTNKAFIPYIFSNDEMKRIFATLDHLPHYKWSNSSTLYPVLFRMLYGCGLRINEALSLKLNDVDIEKGIITILRSKNDKSRLVVMSASLTNVCAAYRNKYLADCEQDDYFFSNKIGNKRSSSQISIFFKEILLKSGITYAGKGPRVHDIRHTFCCHTLKQMIDNKMDMYCALPILSAYIGHSGIKATEKYLRLTKSIFPEITIKTNEYTTDIYPEVYHE